jgi:hypothetical protein
MTVSRLLITFIMAFACGSAYAAAPAVGNPLPVLAIGDRGELVMNEDDFQFVPWRSDTQTGKLFVLQYFGATFSDRDVFQPFTDLLQKSFEPGTVHVTTVLNLDAALWGTGGMVISELEKNKRAHPDATMVVDADGKGVGEWELGDAGTGLMIVDDKGIVTYFSRQALTDDEMQAAVELIRASLAG